MIPYRQLFLVLVTATLFSCAQQSTDLPATQGARLPRVVLETEMGEIVIEVDPNNAPRTVENFLYYVDGGFYDQGRFHRAVTRNNQPNDTVLIEVIQGDINDDRRGERIPAIPLERTSDTGLRHMNGAISMARGTPDSATSSFFICIDDQPSLDFGGQRNPDGQGFAVFGEVVSGMEVVRRIQSAPKQEQRLNPPIGIVAARRL